MPEKPPAPQPPPPRDNKADYQGGKVGEQPGQTAPLPGDITPSAVPTFPKPR